MCAVCSHFGLAFDEPDEVKHFDRVLLAAEMRDLMPLTDCGYEHLLDAGVAPIVPWSPALARVRFLSLFRSLT
jgi:hypothetical protein